MKTDGAFYGGFFSTIVATDDIFPSLAHSYDSMLSSSINVPDSETSIDLYSVIRGERNRTSSDKLPFRHPSKGYTAADPVPRYFSGYVEAPLGLPQIRRRRQRLRSVIDKIFFIRVKS